MTTVSTCFSRLKAVVAMLCVAMALVSVGAGVSSVVNIVQHAHDAVGDHDHHGLGDVVFDDSDHAGGSLEHAGADTADHAPLTGHHHHADGPSGLLALGQEVRGADLSARLKTVLVSDRPTPTSSQSGPDRPPKVDAISV